MSIIYKVFYVLDSKREELLITDSWQSAIDCWSYLVDGLAKKISVNYEGKETLLENKADIESWSNFLFNKNYNRIEKRLMLETLMEQEHDGMEIITEDYGYDLSDYLPREDEDYNAAVKESNHLPEDSVLFHGAFEKMNKEQQDKIINPSHYKMIPKEAYDRFPEGLEYMDLMEYILKGHNDVEAHLLGQVFKYACRLGKKDAKLQDAKKIAWYAERLVKVIENDG